MKAWLITAEWCSPCKELEEDKKNLPPGVEVVDADKNMEFCQKNKIMAVPTLLFEDGSRVVGVNQIKEKLKEMRGDGHGN